MPYFGRPLIPAQLMHAMTQIIASGKLDQSRGGQWIPDPPQTVTFQGVIMPVSNRDLQYAPEGMYTSQSQILYTNGEQPPVGSEFTDPYDGRKYSIKTQLTHGPTHPLQRYIVEAKEEAAPR